MLKTLVALLLLTTASLRADVFNITASERGWVCTISTILCPVSNNGTNAANDYIAGSETNLLGDEAQFRDWFEFAIPTLTAGTLTSATLNLDEPSGSPGGHTDGLLTYAVYGSSGEPLVFTDVTTASPFGSVGTSSGDNGKTVTIALNGAALAAIDADQGSDIFIGGIDSGELSSSTAGDFGFTGPGSVTYNTVLSLQTVPEPTSLFLLAAVLGTLGMAVRKRLVQPGRHRN